MPAKPIQPAMLREFIAASRVFDTIVASFTTGVRGEAAASFVDGTAGASFERRQIPLIVICRCAVARRAVAP